MLGVTGEVPDRKKKNAFNTYLMICLTKNDQFISLSQTHSQLLGGNDPAAAAAAVRFTYKRLKAFWDNTKKKKEGKFKNHTVKSDMNSKECGEDGGGGK